MGKRGKKSSADLAIIPSDNVIAIPRADPPGELTKEQAVEWMKVTTRMPADHFPAETHCYLVQLCRCIVEARRIAQLIDALVDGDEFSISQYDYLLKMQERESRNMSSLGTRMRLTQQTTQDRQHKNPVVTPKPWES